MIPYGRQHVDEDDIVAVVGVLRGDWLTQGPAVEAFEAALCETTGADHAVAFASGTTALHAAMWSAGIGPGCRVVTSPLSFVASASCALWVGAEPSFVDIDPTTLGMDMRRVRMTDALVPVHYAGLPLDLRGLAERPRVIVEDAAHALGARTADGPVGNCTRSDMCVLSFHPVKAITTGEGGAVTTRSAELAERLRTFRNHGIVRRPHEGGWYYEVDRLAPNGRITDLQCALGVSQLRKLERFVGRRNEIAERYRALLADLPLTLPPAAPAGTRHAYHLFAVQVDDRRRVYDDLRAAGIGVQVHYVPIYRHPLFARRGFVPEQFPNTEAVYARLLSLPCHPGLDDATQDVVVATLRRVLDPVAAGRGA